MLLIFEPSEIISYVDMIQAEDVNLQRGMNYQLKGGLSVILMSLRPGAPYSDRIEDGGKTLIYEGHDISKNKFLNSKLTDQPLILFSLLSNTHQ